MEKPHFAIAKLLTRTSLAIALILGALHIRGVAAQVQVPEAWNCNDNFYNAGAGDGCDCNCGAYDPDCDIEGQIIYNCAIGETCVNTKSGECTQSTPAPTTLSSLCRGGENSNFRGYIIDLVENSRNSISRIDCKKKQLTGTIPSQIGNLTNLEHLEISENELLFGEIPTQLGKLEKLTRFLIDDWAYENDLSGSIPTQLGNLKNLQVLKLRRSKLTGKLPTQFGKLIKLEDLTISNHKLSGSIPSQLGRLDKLTLLALSLNEISGQIPTQLGNLGKLNYLYLNNIKLSSSIPFQLGKLGSLFGFHLEENAKFFGQIPTQLGNLGSLKFMRITANDNALSGSIPTQFGKLTRLERLALTGSNTLSGLSGKVPSQMENLAQLSQLSLSRNALTGQIPPWIGRMTSLGLLSLDDNKLSGSIPTQLGRLRILQQLFLNGNDLFGEIPLELGKLSKILTLSLEKNSLSGRLPNALSNLRLMQKLYLSHNELIIDETSPELFESLPRLIVLEIRNNTGFNTTCNNKLLEWYPKISELVSDRDEIFCSSTNLYGELGLNPHILRLDVAAPRQHILFLDVENETVTSSSVNTAWSYDMSSIYADNVNLYTDNLISDIIDNNPNTLQEIEQIRNCENFEDKYLIDEDTSVSPVYFGFEVNLNTVLAGDGALRKCFLFNELAKNNANFNKAHLAVDEYQSSNTRKRHIILETYTNFPVAISNVAVTYEAENSFTVSGSRTGFCGNEANGAIKVVLLEVYDVRSKTYVDAIQLGCHGGNDCEFTEFEVTFNLPFEVPGDKYELRMHGLFTYCDDFQPDELLPHTGWGTYFGSFAVVEVVKETQSSELLEFEFNVTNLRPATNYSVDLRPFYLKFGQGDQVKHRFVYGIQSTTLLFKTSDDAPTEGPVNVTLFRRTDTSITLNWGEVPLNHRSGEIEKYTVTCQKCPRREYSNIRVRQLQIDGLSSKQFYQFTVSAATSTNELGPPSKTLSIQTCRPNTYSNADKGECSKAASGYFFSGKIDGDASACSDYVNEIDVGTCLNAQSARELVLNYGYWRPSIHATQNPKGTQSTIKLCPEASFCISNTDSALSNNTNSSDVHCALHHTGVLCSDCEEGYILSSSGCVACDNKQREDHISRFICYTTAVALLIGLYLVKMLLSSGMLSLTRQKVKSKLTTRKKIWNKFKKVLGHVGSLFTTHISTKLKIWLVTSQILFSLQQSFSTKSAEESNRNGLLLIVALQLERFYRELEVYCYSDISFYKKLLFVSIFPICVISFFWMVYYLLYKSKFSDDKTKAALYRETYGFTLSVLFIIYAPVSQAIIETFLCESFYFADGRERFLIADYRSSCDDDKHQKYEVYAGFMTVLYPVGILIMYGYILHRRRNLFLTDANLLSDENVSRLKLIEFLTRPYINKAYWFEVYELLRKVAMTSIVVVITAYEEEIGNKYAAETYTLVIGMFSLIFVMYVRPYKYDDDFLFSVLSLFILCFSTLIRALGEFSSADNDITKLSEYETMIFTVLAWLESGLLLLFVMANIVQGFMKRSDNKDANKKPTKGENGSSAAVSNANSTISSMRAILPDDVDMAMLIYEDETRNMIEKLKQELREKEKTIQELKSKTLLKGNETSLPGNNTDVIIN